MSHSIQNLRSASNAFELRDIEDLSIRDSSSTAAVETQGFRSSIQKTEKTSVSPSVKYIEIRLAQAQKSLEAKHKEILRLVQDHCTSAPSVDVKTNRCFLTPTNQLKVVDPSQRVSDISGYEINGAWTKTDSAMSGASSRRQNWRGSGSGGIIPRITRRLQRAVTKGWEEHGSEQEDEPEETKKPSPVFADAHMMKEKIKEEIMKPEYNVTNFYKHTGWAQFIARSHLFENITLAVIAANSVWIAVDTDYNKANTLLDANVGFQVGENLFCMYFTLELLTRFVAFENKNDCTKDAWFLFDSMLVIVMVLETWLLNLIFFIINGGGTSQGLGDASVLRLVRLARLTRMARMFRLLRAIPELMILVKGIAVATRSVFFTLCLLIIVIYIFAIAFTQLAEDTPLEEPYFDTVLESMNTLLLRGTLPDMADIVTACGEESLIFEILFLFFILFSSLTVLNMLVGVLCEVVSVVAKVENEQMTIQFVKTKLLTLLKRVGIGENGETEISISQESFQDLLLMPEGAKIFQEVGVDAVGLVDFVDHIFQSSSTLSFPDFMEVILQLRGSNNATVRDVVELRRFMKHLVETITDQMRILKEAASFDKAPTHSAKRNGFHVANDDNYLSEPRAKSTGVGELPGQPNHGW